MCAQVVAAWNCIVNSRTLLQQILLLKVWFVEAEAFCHVVLELHQICRVVVCEVAFLYHAVAIDLGES